MIQSEIVIARPIFEEAIARLLDQSRPISLSINLSLFAGCRQFLLTKRSMLSNEKPYFEMRLLQQMKKGEEKPENLLGVMIFDMEQQNCQAIIFDGSDQPKTVDTLLLVGQNMQRCALTDNATTIETSTNDQQRWSRLIGALDMETLDAFRNLHFAIAGVGRNGSLMATSLMHAGVRNLTLIDPDHMELHNLDAMDGVTLDDLDKPKAEALAQSLSQPERKTPEAVTCSVTSPRGLAALRKADVLISCVDNDGARLAIAMAATLYLKPLLDIGSGITRTDGVREMGGDIRLVLPGESRCLSCFGGFANHSDIDALIENKTIDSPWNMQRAGSLRSLNEINVHYGLRLLEDLFAGEVTHSTWLRLAWQGSIPSVEVLEPPTQHSCPLCGYEGVGDEALPKLPRIAVDMREEM